MSIKLIIFDLDGTLVDLKDTHFDALNKALIDINITPITKEEHLARFDGLNTNTKLFYLGVTGENKNKAFALKQKYTLEAVRKLEFHYQVYEALQRLSTKYKLCVASNSVRDTIKEALMATKYLHFIDFYLSNEDVKNPKPSTEMYLQCMIKAGVSPKETLIIEDSLIGRQGAEQTGALVMGVNSPKDVTYNNIIQFMENNQSTNTTKWKDPKLNILIPMSGAGSRFEKAGFTWPKPLIEVNGKPMIQLVVENLNIDAHYIFLVQKEHYIKYNMKSFLNLIAPGCEIVLVNGLTEGAACTSLLAKDYINNDNPLLIANSDQYLEWDSSAFIYSMIGDSIDGGLATFKATHPKWSFAQTNDLGLVTRVAEKDPISDTATCGVYFWKRGSDYVKYAEQMISKNIRTNNEFYICPVYNEAIANGAKIKIHNVNKMVGLGDPESLKYYLENYK